MTEIQEYPDLGKLDENHPEFNKFTIDRMVGLPIIVEVKDGLVLPFEDREYHGKLAERTVGKPLDVLYEQLQKLYKTWIKSLWLNECANKYQVHDLFDTKNKAEEMLPFKKFDDYIQHRSDNKIHTPFLYKEQYKYIFDNKENLIKRYEKENKRFLESVKLLKSTHNINFKFGVER